MKDCTAALLSSPPSEPSQARTKPLFARKPPAMPPKHVVRSYLYAICASLCMVNTGYDESFFSSMQILPAWVDYFHHPGPPVIGAVNTSFTVGAIIFGFFVSPMISDWLGRKWAIGAGSFVVVASAIMMALAPNIGTFIAARALSGIGSGLMLPAGPVYIGEIVYPATRGRFMSIWQIGYTLGSNISRNVLLGCSFSPQLGQWQWRLVVLLQLIVPAVMILGLIGCPESPRWYLQKGLEQKARDALALVRLPEEVDAEVEEIKSAILFDHEQPQGIYKQLFTFPSYRKRLILAICLNVGQKFTGSLAIEQYSGIILKRIWDSSRTVIMVNSIISALTLIGPFIAFIFIDRVGRRVMFLTSTAGLAAVLLTMATVTTQIKESNSRYSRAVGIAIAFLVWVFQIFFAIGWGTGTWIWTGEVFPLAVRAHAVAIASQSQHIAGAILGQIFPSLFAATGFYVFYFFLGTTLLLGMVIWFFLKETKGVALEHMDALFGGVDHVVAGELLGADTEKDCAKPPVSHTEHNKA